jgi:LacI family transcriptional regulator
VKESAPEEPMAGNAARSDPPTIVDVARVTGVSVSTVSRVVRDHPDVGEATRARVRTAIAELGYRPSPIARALVSGRNRLFGLLVSDIANPFYPQLAKVIEKEAMRRGYGLVICNTEDDESETERYVERLIDQGFEGIIHASVKSDEARTLQLVGDPNRIVFTNRRPTSPHAHYVVSDNVAGARTLTRHLLDQGHRRIGFVKGPAEMSTGEERAEGFLSEMIAYGAEPLFVQGEISMESGAEAVQQLLGAPNRPTAIIGVNDLVALGALEGLLEAGLRVPEDVALAGFDDIQVAGSKFASLTSVAQNTGQMGQRVVRMLSLLSHKPPSHTLREVIPAELIIRRSTSLPLTLRR